jgi:hypothetical protein
MNIGMRIKKVLPLLVAAILTFGLMPAQAMADVAYNQPGKTMEEYQAIVDRLNKEYGTETYIIDQERVDQITANLINTYGYLPFAPPRVITLEFLQQYTLAEFEAEFHAHIKGYSILAPQPYSNQPVTPSVGSMQSGRVSGSGPSRGSYWASYISPNPYSEKAQIDAQKDNNNCYSSCGAKFYHPNPQYDSFGMPFNYFTMSSAYVLSGMGTSILVVRYNGLDCGYVFATASTRDGTFK